MNEHPPLFPSELTPEIIIGSANMKVFTKHYQICQSTSNQGEFPDKRIDKEIGISVRPHIAETLEKLRAFGFYPCGLNPRSEIIWKYVLKSKCQQEFEKGRGLYLGKSISELSAMVKKMKHSATSEVF